MNYNRIVLNEPHASVEGLYDDRLSGCGTNHFISQNIKKPPHEPFGSWGGGEVYLNLNHEKINCAYRIKRRRRA